MLKGGYRGYTPKFDSEAPKEVTTFHLPLTPDGTVSDSSKGGMKATVMMDKEFSHPKLPAGYDIPSEFGVLPTEDSYAPRIDVRNLDRFTYGFLEDASRYPFAKFGDISKDVEVVYNIAKVVGETDGVIDEPAPIPRGPDAVNDGTIPIDVRPAEKLDEKSITIPKGKEGYAPATEMGMLMESAGLYKQKSGSAAAHAVSYPGPYPHWLKTSEFGRVAPVVAIEKIAEVAAKIGESPVDKKVISAETVTAAAAAPVLVAAKETVKAVETPSETPYEFKGYTMNDVPAMTEPEKAAVKAELGKKIEEYTNDTKIQGSNGYAEPTVVGDIKTIHIGKFNNGKDVFAKFDKDKVYRIIVGDAKSGEFDGPVITFLPNGLMRSTHWYNKGKLIGEINVKLS
jgi:hypothetical protein